MPTQSDLRFSFAIGDEAIEVAEFSLQEDPFRSLFPQVDGDEQKGHYRSQSNREFGLRAPPDSLERAR